MLVLLILQSSLLGKLHAQIADLLGVARPVGNSAKHFKELKNLFGLEAL